MCVQDGGHCVEFRTITQGAEDGAFQLASGAQQGHSKSAPRQGVCVCARARATPVKTVGQASAPLFRIFTARSAYFVQPYSRYYCIIKPIYTKFDGARISTANGLQRH